VSAFVSVDGGKPTCLKFFSTGKVRCLKSDFPSADEAQRCAQCMIDEMASAPDAGMPPIRLRDAKFNENSKDFTWSTRQTVDIRRLSAALRAAGIKAESDTSFGDSIMVVITPPGTDRQIKGQVLADGTIRLAGCRDDGELAAHAVATSLNNSGALQGEQVDPASVRCEVWLTKRSFQVCSEHQTINMDKLFAVLNDPRHRQCQHPVLSLWVRDKGEQHFIKSISKVGTACPRLEVKFAPLVIDEWEQTRRCKPEPVSISIHNKGEVQLAGNAEYKVLQAVYYLSDIISRHTEVLLGADDEGAGAPVHNSRTPKRMLEVMTGGDVSGSAHEPHLTPTLMGSKRQRIKTETPATAARSAPKGFASAVSPTVFDYLRESAAPLRQESGEPLVDSSSADAYHQRQLMALAFLRMCQEGSMMLAGAQMKDASIAQEPVAEHGRIAHVAADAASPRSTSSTASIDIADAQELKDDNDTRMHHTCDAMIGSGTPPVSPTGLCSADADFAAARLAGRTTPISPAKVPAKVRRRNNKTSTGAGKKGQGSAAAVHVMSPHPHMMMGMRHGEPGTIMSWMPPAHAWAPHAHAAYSSSPWVATLTNVAPVMPLQPHPA